MACQTRSGVTGMSRWRTPKGASASITAFMSAGSAPTVPASPTPLAPRGFTLVGTSYESTSKSGMSSARGIVHEMLEEGLAKALHDPAVDLPLDEERVDHPSHVVDHGVAHHAHRAGGLVDLHLAHVAAVGERHTGRHEGRGLAEARLEAGRKLARHIGGASHGAEGDAAIGARHRELPVGELDVVRGGLEEMRGDAAAALDHLLGGAEHSGAADADGPRPTVAPSGAKEIAVPPENLDALGRHPRAL